MKAPCIASATLAFLSLTVAAHAQVAPSPNPEDAQRHAVAAAPLAPLVSKTAEEASEAQLRIAERPETAERIATFKKNLFDALRRKGFTVEQAMALTATTAMAPFSSR